MRARGRVAFVSTFSREDLERLVMRRPEVGLRIAGIADERLAMSEDRAMDLAHKEVPGRLAILLLAEDFTTPGDLVVDPCLGSGMTAVAAGYVGRRAIQRVA